MKLSSGFREKLINQAIYDDTAHVVISVEELSKRSARITVKVVTNDNTEVVRVVDVVLPKGGEVHIYDFSRSFTINMF